MNPWLAGLLGGLLIGLSASLLLWLNGRIAGISGAVNGLFDAPRGERDWRIAFLTGLMGGGALTAHLLGAVPSLAHAPVSPWLVVLVGFGTRMGNGCTSGHGVCGLARLPKRSFAAVLTFMATAVITVFVV